MIKYFIACFWIIGWQAAFAILVRRWLAELKKDTAGLATLRQIQAVVGGAYWLTAIFWWGFFIAEFNEWRRRKVERRTA